MCMNTDLYKIAWYHVIECYLSFYFKNNNITIDKMSIVVNTKFWVSNYILRQYHHMIDITLFLVQNHLITLWYIANNWVK